RTERVQQHHSTITINAAVSNTKTTESKAILMSKHSESAITGAHGKAEYGHQRQTTTQQYF
ncbi:MAG: hypothetical protein AAGG53_09795, partial [Cyanobacteria bacterium P01_H01_bin.152]